MFQDIKLNLPSLLYYVLFLLRRMLLVFTLIFLDNWGNFQIGINIVCSAGMLAYTVMVQPYEDPVVNAQEFVNEFFIWVTAYFLLFFTNWVPDDLKLTGTQMNYKNFMGLVMLGVLGLFVAINLSIMIGSASKLGYTKYKARKAMKKR